MIDFETINKYAYDYFSDTNNKTKRNVLWEKLFSSCTFVDINGNNNMIKFANVICSYDVFTNTIIEALGEKEKLNGQNSKSGYNAQKGALFTTYFINLLKLRQKTEDIQKVKDSKIFNNIKSEENDIESIKQIKHNSFSQKYFYQSKLNDDKYQNNFDIDNVGYFEEKIEYNETNPPILNFAEISNDLIKSKKCHSLYPLFYSFIAINYFREADSVNSVIEKNEDKIIVPLDKDFTKTMIEFKNDEFKHIIELEINPFTKFVIENYLNKKHLLKQKSIEIYTNLNSNTYTPASKKTISKHLKIYNEKVLNKIKEVL